MSGYSEDMDILTSFSNSSLIVVCAPRAASGPVAELVAELAVRGPVTILDGGNRFLPYRVTHLLREKMIDINRAAKRIFIRRAFTCYQMLTLLENTPALKQPYILLDLLATFYDDHISTLEARRLLETCLQQVGRLRQFAPMIITLAPPLASERIFLFEMVCERADRVLIQETPVSMEAQLSLFPVS